MDRQELGKLIVSVAKSLKSYQLGDPKIASFLYATHEAGRLGLFASAIKSEKRTRLSRIQTLAAEEGINPQLLIGDLLPWMEEAGLCELRRDPDGTILELTSLILAYHDLMTAVSTFYERSNPTQEDRACLTILAQASELPRPESAIRHTVAGSFGEETASTALQLAKLYRIVVPTGDSNNLLLYAPRVWSGLGEKAASALTPLDLTQREVVIHLVNRVRTNQGYPERLLRSEAKTLGAIHLLDMAIGIALLNRTNLQLGDGRTRSFLTTPHFYSDLRDEFGEDMCDRVKIFLDSIRNGQYYGSRSTGRILDPTSLLRALLNRGEIGPATAISQDYIIAEKAGIVRVHHEGIGSMAVMELGQRDTIQKVLEIVSSGTVEPAIPRMDFQHLSDGRLFRSIEQSRAELGATTGQFAELEHEILRRLREG